MATIWGTSGSRKDERPETILMDYEFGLTSQALRNHMENLMGFEDLAFFCHLLFETNYPHTRHDYDPDLRTRCADVRNALGRSRVENLAA